METKNMIGGIVSLAVVVICVATIMMPVLSDAQKTAGDEITKSNAEQLSYGEYGQYWDEDMTFVFESPANATTAADTTVTINGDVINLRTNFNRHMILTSEELVVEINGYSSDTWVGIVYYKDNGTFNNVTIPLNESFTVTYDASEGTLQFVYSTDSIDITTNSDYCFAISNTQDYCYLNSSSEFTNMYMNQDLITSKLGGVIDVFSTTVTIDNTSVPIVIVSDVGGTRVLYDETDYSGEITADLVFNGLELAEGTTDIYTGGSPSFTLSTDGTTIDPENISPARSFIISEVSGHEASGAAYSLYGVIPALVIVSIVMGAISLAVNTKRD